LRSHTSCVHAASLHDALPILARSGGRIPWILLLVRVARPVSRDGIDAEPELLEIGTPAQTLVQPCDGRARAICEPHHVALGVLRSEEHTSELQSHLNLVCRLL